MHDICYRFSAKFIGEAIAFDHCWNQSELKSHFFSYFDGKLGGSVEEVGT